MELAQKEGGKIECGQEPLFLPDKNKQVRDTRRIIFRHCFVCYRAIL